MKITCKTCRKRFKIKNKNSVDCDRSDCRVKYDSDLLTLEFNETFIDQFMTDVKIIEDFQSPSSETNGSKTDKIWTEEEWQEHLTGMGMCG